MLIGSYFLLSRDVVPHWVPERKEASFVIDYYTHTSFYPVQQVFNSLPKVRFSKSGRLKFLPGYVEDLKTENLRSDMHSSNFIWP